MIRGNEAAIDLGLEVLMAVRSDRPCTQAEIAAYIDAAREILGLPTKPFQTQDLFYLEHVAFRKNGTTDSARRRASANRDTTSARRKIFRRCMLPDAHPAPRRTERVLLEFHDQAARELVAANRSQIIAYARFEAAGDIMGGLVAAGIVRAREKVIPGVGG